MGKVSIFNDLLLTQIHQLRTSLSNILIIHTLISFIVYSLYSIYTI